jgi:hypothetical protein
MAGSVGGRRSFFPLENLKVQLQQILLDMENLILFRYYVRILLPAFHSLIVTIFFHCRQNAIGYRNNCMTSVTSSLRLLRASMKFIDIGANLTDVMYQGVYNGSSRHPPDLEVSPTLEYH